MKLISSVFAGVLTALSCATYAQSSATSVNNAAQVQQGGVGNSQGIDLGSVRGQAKSKVSVQKLVQAQSGNANSQSMTVGDATGNSQSSVSADTLVPARRGGLGAGWRWIWQLMAGRWRSTATTRTRRPELWRLRSIAAAGARLQLLQT